MPTEITIPGLFHSQVCSDLPLDQVIAWMDDQEMSSCTWTLATPELMAAYGAGDPAVVDCADRPGHKHYLLVASSGVIEAFLEAIGADDE